MSRRFDSFFANARLFPPGKVPLTAPANVPAFDLRRYQTSLVSTPRELFPFSRHYR
jgi:hypothetical protein